MITINRLLLSLSAALLLKMTAANRIRVSKMLPEDTTASTTTTTGTPPWIPEGSTSVDWNDPSTTVEIISTTVADLVGHNTSVVSPTITNNTERVATIVPETAANIENRLRWIDYRRQHSAYPPRVPNVPGIPSGFRNPLANVASNTANANTASLSEIENNQPPEVNMYNPGTHHSFFSGASSNPMGFGGAVNMDDVDVSPFKVPTTNTVRRYNITRVEHIAAECSDDYMKVVIRFNGTFNGLIYSSGYVHDLNCIYVNGSGRNYYEFYIRLNQCGTLGRQEMYHPTMPGEARRRDQLMWNTLSIQYNALIEEEFDEHFRLTCEYGSDFWKTVTFPSVNVEINTGSPVIFTINPPQCQMEVRRGFGIAGTRTSGPVTVGDPLTLLIHMKSEKAGFDILVKNCIAHNGAQQRMQLIDFNGCVLNEKLISPFRGTYNSENGHQVSLYSYLKAFRFTGSPALYLECDIHMCHNRCPPQRCYWRNLAKRSTDELESDNSSLTTKPILSESISLFQALEVHHDNDESSSSSSTESAKSGQSLEANLICLRSGGFILVLTVFVSLMFLSLGTSICYCLRMRRIKYYHQNLLQNIHHGTDFGGQSTLRSSAISSSVSSDCSVHNRSPFFRFH